MFVLSNFFSALAYLINFVCNAYIWVIIGRVFISWVNADPYNPVVRFLHAATEPVLSRLRRLLPFLVMGGIDFSPMMLLAILIFLQKFLALNLHQLAG